VPAAVDARFAKQLEVDHFAPGQTERTDGNIWQPGATARAASGGWRTTRERLVARFRR